MNSKELEKVINKLEVSDLELNKFRTYKDNYYLTDILFIKNDKKYKIVIEYDVNNISHLFGKDITKDELFYTLKCGNKIILKRERKNDIKKWLEYNLK